MLGSGIRSLCKISLQSHVAALFGDVIEWKLWQVLAFYLDQSSPLSSAFDTVQDNNSFLKDQVINSLNNYNTPLARALLDNKHHSMCFKINL